MHINFTTVCAVAGLVISAGQLIAVGPIVATFYFKPDVQISQTSNFTDSSSFALDNTGNGAAVDLLVEFDAFVKVTSVSARPALEIEVKHQPNGNFTVRFPQLAAGEATDILVNYEAPAADDTFVREFGTVFPIYVRSDEGSGKINYPNK